MLNTKVLNNIEKWIVLVTFFLFPIIFLPQFPNVLGDAKLLLLTVAVILLFTIKAVDIFFNKKLVLTTSFFDSALYLLVAAYFLSTIIMAPNKIESLIDVNRGASLVLLLVILTFFSSRYKSEIFGAVVLSGAVLLITQLLGYFNLLKFLPNNLLFINNKTFNLFGSPFDLLGLGVFLAVLAFSALREGNKPEPVKKLLLEGAFLLGVGLAVLNVYILVTQIKPVFMPFSASWAIAVEGLKTMTGALFGKGPANYLAVFTEGKPAFVNNYEGLWQANMEFSRSAFLHLFSEVGLLGITALVLIFLQIYKPTKKITFNLPLMVILLWGIFLPISVGFFFALFLLVIFVREAAIKKEIDLTDIDMVRLVVVSLFTTTVIGLSYFSYRRFLASYLLKRAVVAASQNQVQQIYDYQKEAIGQNPWSESAHLNFAQTNMILANDISQKKKLTDQDKQNVAALIQQGIAEGKELVRLNPNNAPYWANLAEIYRLVINVAQGADTWAITSYQRAISLDKNNPQYYFNLGTIYFGLGNYDEAAKFIEQAVTLKPNYPNFSYNLAWSYARAEKYAKAVNAMEYALQYVKKGSNDYKKAEKELNEFKAKLPKSEENSTTSPGKPETLTQPTPIPTVSPIMKLPTAQPSPTTEPTPRTEPTIETPNP